MQIKIKVEGKTSEIKANKEKSVEDLLRKLEINTETVVVRMNGKLVSEKEELKDGDFIELIKFVSSG